MPIPGASHINHMPAHIWSRIGRWGDAVQASLRAWQSDQNAAKGTGFMTYPAHDLHMLTFAASMDGQRGVAMQAGARDSHASPVTRCCCRWRWCDSASSTKWPRSVNVRRTTFPPACGISPQGMRRFAAAIAAPRAAALERLEQTARSSKAAFRIHPAKTLLGTLAAILEGEIHRAAANAAAMIEAFERAVSLQDRLLVDDPEPLPLAARHWLGAALLDQAPLRGRGARLPGGFGAPPAQRVGTDRTASGAEGTGKADERRGRRSPVELGARGCHGSALRASERELDIDATAAAFRLKAEASILPSVASGFSRKDVRGAEFRDAMTKPSRRRAIVHLASAAAAIRRPSPPPAVRVPGLDHRSAWERPADAGPAALRWRYSIAPSNS